MYVCMYVCKCGFFVVCFARLRDFTSVSFIFSLCFVFFSLSFFPSLSIYVCFTHCSLSLSLSLFFFLFFLTHFISPFSFYFSKHSSTCLFFFPRAFLRLPLPHLSCLTASPLGHKDSLGKKELSLCLDRSFASDT